MFTDWIVSQCNGDEELIAKGRVEPYSVEGQRYVRVADWAKHQRIDNAGKPRVPTPDEDDGTWNQELGRVFAESRGEAPRTAEGLDDSPLAREVAREIRCPQAEPRPRPR